MFFLSIINLLFFKCDMTICVQFISSVNLKKKMNTVDQRSDHCHANVDISSIKIVLSTRKWITNRYFFRKYFQQTTKYILYIGVKNELTFRAYAIETNRLADSQRATEYEPNICYWLRWWLYRFNHVFFVRSQVPVSFFPFHCILLFVNSHKYIYYMRHITFAACTCRHVNGVSVLLWSVHCSSTARTLKRQHICRLLLRLCWSVELKYVWVIVIIAFGFCIHTLNTIPC